MKKACLRASWAIVILLLAAPALGGCSSLLESASSSAQAATAPQDLPAGVVDLQHGGQIMKPAAGFSCPNQSLRHCFTESDMVVYYEYVLPYVDSFFQKTWPSLPLPANVYFLSTGAQTQEGCTDPHGGNTADDMSYEYCPADHNVYLGQRLAWLLYSDAGDVAPAIGLAHEFGHGVQTQVGVPVPQSDAETLVHENQADCVSGAWLGYANDQGLLEKSDVPVIQQYLNLIASSENDPNRTHGDFNERGQALELGGEKGIAACDAYYPDNPISTA